MTPLKVDKSKGLAKLGAETLANALLDLAQYSVDADAVVTRLLATPRQNANNLKKRLSVIVDRTQFISFAQSAAFARELTELLRTLESSDCEPRTGVQSVVAFLEVDAEIIENCDDSDGLVGNVFCYDAADLFTSFAVRCEDKEWLLALVIELNQSNEYWVRQTLIERMPEFLPEALLPKAVEQIWELARTDNNAFARDKWMMKNPQLLERVCREKSNDKPSVDSVMEIAALYFDCGNVDQAQSWCEKIPDSSYHSIQRDKILLAIYEAQGNLEKHVEKAWQIFYRNRSVESLDLLIKAVGETERETIVEQESKKILTTRSFNANDAIFLLQLNRIENAEEYIIKCAGKLDGVFYLHLLEISKLLLKHKKLLAVSLINRALLDSILARAKSKSYHHGIEYLQDLDKWAKKIDVWKGFASHDTYLANLREAHKRKHGFWSQYAPPANSLAKKSPKSRS